MVEVSTSVLNVEEDKFAKTAYDLEVAKTDYFHIDVMDGKFVKQNTTSKMKEYMQIIKQISNIPVEVHLMVDDVQKYIEKYLDFNPNIIIFQIESLEHDKIKEKIDFIKQNNCKAGIAIKPNTKVELIEEFLPFLHQVLVMTVEPGKGGQTLIPNTIEKVEQLVKIRDQKNLDFSIGVDGGINIDTAELAKQAGVDVLVAGTAIVKQEDLKKAIHELKEP